MGYIYCLLELSLFQFSTHFLICGGQFSSCLRFSKVETSQTRQSFSSINPSMALKLSPFTTPSLKSPSFSVPQMASVRSSKFAMASTLRSNSKSVLSFYSLSLFSLVFLCQVWFFLVFG